MAADQLVRRVEIAAPIERVVPAFIRTSYWNPAGAFAWERLWLDSVDPAQLVHERVALTRSGANTALTITIYGDGPGVARDASEFFRHMDALIDRVTRNLTLPPAQPNREIA